MNEDMKFLRKLKKRIGDRGGGRVGEVGSGGRVGGYRVDVTKNRSFVRIDERRVEVGGRGGQVRPGIGGSRGRGWSRGRGFSW